MGDSPARKARIRAREAVRYARLKSIGAVCGNCDSFMRSNPSVGIKGPWCRRYSDVQGLQVAEEGGTVSER